MAQRGAGLSSGTPPPGPAAADATGDRLPVPRGWLRRLLRLPVVLDEAGLGRLTGNRLLIVDTVGRRTGRRYRTPLEVIRYRPDEPEWTVVAGWRARPDWLLNLQQAPALAFAAAGRRWTRPSTRVLPADERLDVLAAYALAHPRAARVLFRLLGWGDPRRPGVLRAAAEGHLMLAFRPEA